MKNHKLISTSSKLESGSYCKSDHIIQQQEQLVYKVFCFKKKLYTRFLLRSSVVLQGSESTEGMKDQGCLIAGTDGEGMYILCIVE
jgi:hypothetical protein